MERWKVKTVLQFNLVMQIGKKDNDCDWRGPRQPGSVVSQARWESVVVRSGLFRDLPLDE